MHRRPRKGKPVRLCPHCGSVRIVLIAGSILGQVYRCEKCGYQGSLVFETDVAVDRSDPSEPSDRETSPGE